MYKSYITDIGAEAIANLKNENITLSRLVVSDDVSDEYLIFGQTEIENEVYELSVVSSETINNVFNVTGRIESLNVNKGFYVKQVGLFLTINGEEVLFQISQVKDGYEGNYVPSKEEAPDYFAEFSLSIAMVNDNTISCTVDVTRYLKIEEFNKTVDELLRSIGQKASTSDLMAKADKEHTHLLGDIETENITSESVAVNNGTDVQWEKRAIKIVEGQTLYPTYDSEGVTARTGAVIIGDISERTYGDPSADGVADERTAGNVATGAYSIAMGSRNNATGVESIAGGFDNEANGNYSIALGDNNIVDGTGSVAMGECNTAISGHSCAIGLNNKTNKFANVALGSNNTVSGSNGVALGNGNTVSGNYAVGIGSGCTAGESTAVALGNHCIANGTSSFSVGHYNSAAGVNSFAMGYENTAKSYQTVFGRRATTSDGATSLTDVTGDVFKIGIGTSGNARSNVFRATNNGFCYGLNAFGASGADFAEYFEWLDQNPDNEDRRGLFVTLEGEKIRVANKDDDYILGVVSATPTVIGDVQSENWKDVYLKDVFGERLTETVEVEESTDEDGNLVPTHTETRFILNPDYDSTKEYISRDKRKEWSAVGLTGKLIVTDDGTCEVNGFCTVSEGGKATKSDTETKYRVMARIDESHIKVLLK